MKVRSSNFDRQKSWHKRKADFVHASEHVQDMLDDVLRLSVRRPGTISTMSVRRAHSERPEKVNRPIGRGRIMVPEGFSLISFQRGFLVWPLHESPVDTRN